MKVAVSAGQATASSTVSRATEIRTQESRSCECDRESEQPRCGFDLRAIPVFPALEVGPVGDPLEREADQMAERVMRETPPIKRDLSPGPRGTLQRICASCEQEPDEQLVQRKLAGPAAAAPTMVHALPRSSGRPLDASARAFLEPRFARDFSGVRIHDNAEAARSAADLGARAFTSGRDVYFAEGQYRPDTRDGRRLLAHELAHVIQQERLTARGRILREVWPVLASPPGRSEATEIASERQFLMGPIDRGTDHCRFTPRFLVGERYPSIEVRLRAQNPPDGQWRMNVFPGSQALLPPCSAGYDVHKDAGSTHKELVQTVAVGGRAGRDLFVRIRNGAQGKIPTVVVTLRPPVLPAVSNEPSLSDFFHGVLQLLAFVPGVGIVAEGVDAVIYAAEGEWGQAGLSVAAMLPALGEGFSMYRQAGRLGIRIERRTMRALGREEIEARIRRATRQAEHAEAAEARGATRTSPRGRRGTPEAAEHAAPPGRRIPSVWDGACRLGSILCSAPPRSMIERAGGYPPDGRAPFPRGDFRIRSSADITYQGHRALTGERLRQLYLSQPAAWSPEFRAAYVAAGQKWPVDAANHPWQVHHIKPIDWGGTSHISNLVAIEEHVHVGYTRFWNSLKLEMREAWRQAGNSFDSWDQLLGGHATVTIRRRPRR